MTINEDMNISEYINISEQINMSEMNMSGLNSSEHMNFSELTDDFYMSVFSNKTARIIYIFLYTAVFICCISGNLLVVVVILLSKKMRTVTNFFLGNLAVADFCVGLFCVIPNLTVFLEKHWYFGWLMCKLVYFIQAMCYTASVSLLTVISIERYAAIIYPLKLKQFTTLCLLRVVVIAIWVMSAVLAVPLLLMYEAQDWLDKQYCLTTTRIDEKWLLASTFLFGYVIPLVLMTCMYVRIAIVLWSSSTGKGLTVTMTNSNSNSYKRSILKNSIKSTGNNCVHHVIGCPLFDDVSSTSSSNMHSARKNVNNHNACICKEIASSGQGQADDYVNDWPSTKRKRDSSFYMAEINKPYMNCNPASKSRHNLVVRRYRSNTEYTSTGDNAVLLARRRIIRLLVAVVASFAICVLPYHAVKLWLLFDTGRTNHSKEITHATAFLFYYLNSALNPILYAFLSQNFRRSLKDLCVFSKTKLRKPSYTGISRNVTNSTL